MDLRISLLTFNFTMIYIIHKNLVLIKSHVSCKIIFSNSFLRSIIDYFFFENNFFFHNI